MSSHVVWVGGFQVHCVWQFLIPQLVVRVGHGRIIVGGGCELCVQNWQHTQSGRQLRGLRPPMWIPYFAICKICVRSPWCAMLGSDCVLFGVRVSQAVLLRVVVMVFLQHLLEMYMGPAYSNLYPRGEVAVFECSGGISPSQEGWVAVSGDQGLVRIRVAGWGIKSRAVSA